MSAEIIYINGRFLSQKITGVQRFALEMITELDALPWSPVKPRLVMLLPNNVSYFPELKKIELRFVGTLTGNLWEQVELPLYSRGGLLLNLCNAAPLFKKNQIVTIHDVVVFRYPRAFSFTFRFWYKIMLNIVSRRARCVLTDSEFSRGEIEATLGVAMQKTCILTLGKEHILRTTPSSEILSRWNLGGRPFVLAVSSLNPYKNFQAVVKAIENLGDLDFDVVIAGGTNPKVFCSAGRPLSQNVKYLGYVTDGELRALYGAATAFVFPSLYEGFGLPPLEAMACGCPVIMSNRASLPEVGGNAVLYVDPDDIEGFAQAIRQILSDDELRSNLCERGLAQVNKFSWKKTAMEVQTVLQTMILEGGK